jgi:hypothetical protein
MRRGVGGKPSPPYAAVLVRIKRWVLPAEIEVCYGFIEGFDWNKEVGIAHHTPLDKSLARKVELLCHKQGVTWNQNHTLRGTEERRVRWSWLTTNETPRGAKPASGGGLVVDFVAVY